MALTIKILRTYWKGDLGIHTHNNLGKAIANSLSSIQNGVNWVDCTVTGMGRGPGNAQTEYLLIEMQNIKKRNFDISPVLKLINSHFGPMQQKYKWGSNPYYYLAGKHGIHPTYIQEMLMINFEENEIMAAIDQLRLSGG